MDDILEDKAKFIDQDHSKATYAKKIDKEESRIDWDEDASKIIGKINGLFPPQVLLLVLMVKDIKF